MALSVLVSAWLVGAMGGVHCVAMCGGFMTAVGARDASLQPLLPARAIVIRSLAYHAGRIATYAALGSVLGAAGALAYGAVDLVPVQRALHVAANLFLLALGAGLALRMPGVGVAWLQRAGAMAFAAGLPTLRPLLERPGAAGRIALGLAWGLMPCALVYSVAPLALFAGGAWQGAAVLLAFGLGTLPNLMASTVALDRIARHASRGAIRRAGGALMIAFAIAGIWRAFARGDAPLANAFCLVP
jgi:sulfite exporter TauE/SafE